MVAMRHPPNQPKQRGVSPIVGELLLVGIIITAMGIIAAVVLVTGTRERFVDLEVRLENAAPPPADNVRVILRNLGGDSLGIPDGPDDEFRVVGSDLFGEGWENQVAWNSWTFSDPADGFGFGENAVGILRADDASILIGDEIRITVKDIYSDKLIFSEPVTVENSALY